MKQDFDKIFVIAEAGVNHNGSLALAKKLVGVAAAAGADAVKFQTFKAEKVISKYAPKAQYQKKTTGKNESQLDMARKLELPPSAFAALCRHCRVQGIMFLSTPFDLDSIDVLAHLGLPIFKIPSGEITNLPYLRKIGALRKKIILSTGMSTLPEIRKALGILTKAGTLKRNISLLHCNTEYPTPYEDVNLRAMCSMRRQLKVPVGYSDHTRGIEISVAAAALGATIIEKHFTLDQNMQGPDHKASLSPQELKALVTAIRHVERALGHGVKRPSASEAKNLVIARKSLIAAQDIKKGALLTAGNLTVKRPGNGISPMRWDDVIGTKAKRAFREDELIEV